jgi:major membrane immunogen (membrane-anchored lipoprotein)
MIFLASIGVITLLLIFVSCGCSNGYDDDIKRGVYREDYYDSTGEDWEGTDEELYEWVDEDQNKGLYYD